MSTIGFDPERGSTFNGRMVSQKSFSVLHDALQDERPVAEMLGTQQNIFMENMYQLYHGREVKILSINMTQLIALSNGSWILGYLGPITISYEQTFRWFRAHTNIIPHQPVAPGGIPRMMTTSRETFVRSKVSEALMTGIDLRVLLDPNMSEQAVAQCLYGLSVSAVFTLQQRVIIEAIRAAYDRQVLSARVAPNSGFDIQRQMFWETQNFAVINKNPGQWAYHIANLISAVPGANLVILWQGGRARLGAYPLQKASDVQAFYSFANPVTGQLMKQELNIDQYGIQQIPATGTLGYIEVPNLVMNPEDLPFNPLQNNVTLAQYYVIQQKEQRNVTPKSRFGRTDIKIYDLPSDSHKTITPEMALPHTALFAPAGTRASALEGGNGEEYIAQHYHQALIDYVDGLNQKKVPPPRGKGDRNNENVRRLAAWSQEPPGFHDFHDSRTGARLRDQFMFTSYNNGRWHIPLVIGAIERRFLTHGWVRHMAEQTCHRIDHAMKSDSTFTNAVEQLYTIWSDLNNRTYNRGWFEDVIATNLPRGTERTPEDRARREGIPLLDEFAPNSYGSLILPSNPDENIPEDSRLAGFGNMPGMRTIAAEATKMNSPYRELANRLQPLIRTVDQGLLRLSEALPGNDTLNPKNTASWFHRDDRATAALFRRDAPAFLRVVEGQAAATGTTTGESSPLQRYVTGPRGLASFYRGEVDQLHADLRPGDIDVLALGRNGGANATLRRVGPYISLLTSMPTTEQLTAAPFDVEKDVQGNPVIKTLARLELLKSNAAEDRTQENFGIQVDAFADGVQPFDLVTIEDGKIVKKEGVGFGDFVANSDSYLRGAQALVAQRYLEGTSDMARIEGFLDAYVTNPDEAIRAYGPKPAPTQPGQPPVAPEYRRSPLTISAVLARQILSQNGNGAGRLVVPGDSTTKYTQPLPPRTTWAGVSGRAEFQEPSSYGGVRFASGGLAEAASVRGVLGPWEEREEDLARDRMEGTAHELAYRSILATPTTLPALQQIARSGCMLPFDIVHWRLGMSFRMYSILLASQGAIETKMNPAHVRTAVNNMRGEVYIQNWIDYLVVAPDEKKLGLLPNVCTGGYNGGVNTEYVRYPEEDLQKDIGIRPSLIATIQPLTEELKNVVNFANQPVDSRTVQEYSRTASSMQWSGAWYYGNVYQSWIELARVHDREVAQNAHYVAQKSDAASVEMFYRAPECNLVAFPGPFIAMGTDGYMDRIVPGQGPAGDMSMNWTGARDVWMGGFKDFPVPNVHKIAEL